MTKNRRFRRAMRQEVMVQQRQHSDGTDQSVGQIVLVHTGILAMQSDPIKLPEPLVLSLLLLKLLLSALILEVQLPRRGLWLRLPLRSPNVKKEPKDERYTKQRMKQIARQIRTTL